MSNLAFAQSPPRQRQRFETEAGHLGDPLDAEHSAEPPRLDGSAREYEEAIDANLAPVIAAFAGVGEDGAPPSLTAPVDLASSESEASSASLGDAQADPADRIGPIPGRRRGWFATALVAALLLHAGVVVALLSFARTPPIDVPSGEIPVQIVVEAPPPAQQPAPAQPPAEATPPPAAEAPPPPAEAAPPPVAETPPVEAAQPPVEMAPPPEDAAAPAITPPPAAQVPPPPDPRVVEQARQQAEARRAEQARQPALARQQAEAERQRVAAQQRAEAEKRRAAENLQRQQAQEQQARQAAAAASAAVSYRSAVFARLERNQHYPENAREHGIQGQPTISFTLDQSGHVVSVSLVRPSGSADLDAEAVAMVRRSEPFPPPPPGAPRSFTGPVSFRLN